MAAESRTKLPGEVLNAAIDMRERLESGESITGTPTVDATPSAGITIDNVAVNGSSRVINGKSVPAGKAVTFRVAAGTAGTTYALTVEAVTNASPAQTIQELCYLTIEG